WLYATNILATLRGSGETPLQTAHFWSLAVEEQFYLIWPFIVWRCSRSVLWRVAVGAVGLALLVRIALVVALPNGIEGAYVLMPARIDALGIGAILALLVRDPDGLAWIARVQRFLLPGAVLAILSIFAIRGSFEYRDPIVVTVGFSIVALGCGALIGRSLVAPVMSRTSRFFRSRVLRSLGRYSYALYVVHYPLFYPVNRLNLLSRIPRVLGSILPGWIVMSIVLVGSAFAVAWVSWRVYESPILRLKRFVPEPIASGSKNMAV
ncbi:MAG TPA: acyltransferase, partial [Gemmatimonadaceae bacterium]|nr:acyltransferase [Gemmatimonadaceae bacterium]